MPLTMIDTATGRPSPGQLPQEVLGMLAARPVQAVRAASRRQPRPVRAAVARTLDDDAHLAWLTPAERERALAARAAAAEQLADEDVHLAWLAPHERARALRARARA